MDKTDDILTPVLFSILVKGFDSLRVLLLVDANDALFPIIVLLKLSFLLS